MCNSLCYPPATIECLHDAKLGRVRSAACVHAPGGSIIRATCLMCAHAIIHNVAALYLLADWDREWVKQIIYFCFAWTPWALIVSSFWFLCEDDIVRWSTGYSFAPFCTVASRLIPRKLVKTKSFGLLRVIYSWDCKLFLLCFQFFPF